LPQSHRDTESSVFSATLWQIYRNRRESRKGLEIIPDLLLRHRLRAGDAIQLASCAQLQKNVGAPVQFIVYDARLTDAAREEGLTL
jgi:predicted nucleic acid-binding protein